MFVSKIPNFVIFFINFIDCCF